MSLIIYKSKEKVNAVQYSGSSQSASYICRTFELAGSFIKINPENWDFDTFVINSSMGGIRVNVGDYVVRPLNGEPIFVRKPESFKEEYEEQVSK